MRVSLSTHLILFLSLLLSTVKGEVARRANDFHHTFGVNVHLHFGNTCYDNWTVLFPAIVGSGIKHYRDGLIDTTLQKYYDRHNLLGNAGLKGTFITAWGQNATLIANWPKRINNFEYYEGVNEPNLQSNANWISDTRTLIQTIKMAHNTSFKIIGPSITDKTSFEAMGDISAYCDFGNMHDYFGAFSPGNPGWGGRDQYGVYGSMDWNMKLANITVPNKPLISTETGWSGKATPTKHKDIPLDVQAKYILRDYLLHFNKGVALTHLYQFCDSGVNGDGDWGLLDVNNNKKPSYYAVQGLLSLIQDNSTNSASFTPGTLNIVLGGNATNVMRTVLQKVDGSFWVILWIEKSDWNVDANGTGENDVGAPITVPPQIVTVSFSSGNFSASYFIFSSTNGQVGAPSSLTFNEGVAKNITVSSMPSILKLVPPQSSTSTTTTSSSSSSSSSSSPSSSTSSTSTSTTTTGSTTSPNDMTSASGTHSYSLFLLAVTFLCLYLLI